ncbi:hypothetical protein CPB84DRAFT_1841487 [Gymnopilus junonius]|uniref:Uncharacterized protein n=1 Tax=Gymnopilus junonius TaxID=109634 RepID=A0A9P5P0V0_GYMJU|nr:hypothetical protein CPB84DRAFT_1841487 [Gymnopilus junonius]
MSFQHFRLGELPVHQPQPPVSATKQPYGSGDTDDGYTLIFATLAAFQEWRNAEEERHCVEFVKGDTHGSKADPPRFKDHTKLVCARHSRSGRKKYIKKHPERVRKVPSRKLEGQGCQASISYKTYFDTEEVRACYISQHSHEIGLANLPFTRRGRKAAVQQEKERSRNKSAAPSDSTPVTSSSTVPVGLEPQQGASQGVSSFSTAVSMLAPLPAQSFPAPTAQPYGYTPAMSTYSPIQSQQSLPHERWENMATLFQAIREHARAFEYPAASVAALETVLIRLYLESPMGVSPGQTMGSLLHNSMITNRNQPSQSVSMHASTNGHQPVNGSTNDGGSVSNAEDE